MTKFSNVPVEEKTTILFQTEAMLGEYEILYQRWYWSNLIAESIIFANDDVAKMKDSAIQEMVRKSPMVKKDSDMTLKRTSGFCFVNFNFEAD